MSPWHAGWRTAHGSSRTRREGEDSEERRRRPAAIKLIVAGRTATPPRTHAHTHTWRPRWSTTSSWAGRSTPTSLPVRPGTLLTLSCVSKSNTSPCPLPDRCALRALGPLFQPLPAPAPARSSGGSGRPAPRTCLCSPQREKDPAPAVVLCFENTRMVVLHQPQRPHGCNPPPGGHASSATTSPQRVPPHLAVRGRWPAPTHGWLRSRPRSRRLRPTRRPAGLGQRRRCRPTEHERAANCRRFLSPPLTAPSPNPRATSWRSRVCCDRPANWQRAKSGGLVHGLGQPAGQGTAWRCRRRTWQRRWRQRGSVGCCCGWAILR